MTGSPVLPMRPMTVGELLDAAAALLRTRWRSLLGLSLAFAFVEQIFMTLLRWTTIEDVRPQYYNELYGDGSLLWLWITVGLTSEIAIISLLSAPAARAAATIATGGDVDALPPTGLTGGQWKRAAAFAGLLTVFGGVAAALFFLPWFAVFSIFGLAVPVLMVDRLSPWASWWRSAGLARRSGGRTVSTLLLAYGVWLIIRLAVTCGFIMLVQFSFLDFTTILVDNYLIALAVVYVVVNTACYAMLGCVAAVTHLEARIRSEGLDIAIDRMRARDEPIVLTAPEGR